MAYISAREKSDAYHARLPEHIRFGEARKEYDNFAMTAKVIGGLTPLANLVSGAGSIKRGLERAEDNATKLEKKQSEYERAKNALEYVRMRRGRKARQLAEAETEFEAAGQALSNVATSQKTVKAMGVASAVGTVVSELVNQTMRGFSFAVSGIAMSTGNGSLQERIMRKQEVINDYVTAISTEVSGGTTGALVGSIFGPMGTLVGGIVGIAYGAIKAQTDYENKYNSRAREWAFNVFKLDTARSVTEYRAGVSAYSGRLHQY